MGELARAVTAEFTPALPSTTPTSSLRLRSEGIEATCDRERVAQIMRILIDNALAHTPHGTQILVSAERSNGSVCNRPSATAAWV